jgi:hypothetical protein
MASSVIVKNSGNGNFLIVATSLLRDAIPLEQRTLGMRVEVTQDNLFYTLLGGLTNSNWIEVNPSLQDWKPSTQYLAKDTIYDATNKILYRAKLNYTSALLIATDVTNNSIEVIAGGVASNPFDRITSPITIYIATTGNDLTGTGTVGAPYYSIQKAFSSLKTVIDASVTIQIADGVYDLTTYGNVYANHLIFTKSGSVIVRNNTTILLSTGIAASGTFTSHSLLQKGAGATDVSSLGLIHNQSGASWSVNNYVGMILYPTTMQNGHALPAASYRYIPVLANGSDWFETAPAYQSTSVTTQQYQDFGAYQIRSYNVTLIMSGNKIYFPETAGLISFNGLSITNLGGISGAGIEGSLDANTSPRFLNCFVGFNPSSKDTSGSVVYQWSYVDFGNSTGNAISTIQGCAIKSSANGTGNTTPISVGGTFTGNNMLCTGTLENAILWNGRIGIGAVARNGLRDISKVIGPTLAIHTKNATTSFFNTGGTWIKDANCKFFLQLSQQDRQTILAGIFDLAFPLTFLPAEPSVGRVTWDSVTEVSNYFNNELGYNLLSIAPITKQYKLGDHSGVNRKTTAQIIALTGLGGPAENGLRIFNTDLKKTLEYRYPVWVEV